jgi:hypothetical protein
VKAAVALLAVACAGSGTRWVEPPPPPEAIAGLWAIADGSSTVMRVAPQGAVLSIDAWATDTDVHYEVTGVSWDGKRLRATFRYPPSGATTTSDLLLVNRDRLEGTVAGAYEARETWLRKAETKTQ